MADQRLIHLPDDENSLGNFADESGPVSKEGESQHFFGITPPDSDAPSATADDRGFVAEQLHYAPLRPASLSPDAPAPPIDAAEPKPGAPRFDRFVPGWKTVAVLATLLALEAVRVLAPMISEAMNARPRFTMAASPPAAAPGAAPHEASAASAATPATPTVQNNWAPITTPDPPGHTAASPSFLPTPEPAPTRVAPSPSTRTAPEAPVSTPSRPGPVTAVPAPSRPIDTRATATASIPPPAATLPVPTPPSPALSASPPVSIPAVSTPPVAEPDTTASSAARLPANSPRTPAPARPAPPAVAPPPETAAATAVIAPVSDESAVRSVLERYRSAYSDLSVNEAKAVWPSVDAKTLTKAFDQLQSQQLQFVDCQVTVTGDRANAVCGGQAAWVPKVGSRSERSTFREWNFNLRRGDGRWLIAGVEMR